VIFASGQKQIGCDRLLEFLSVYAPAPSEREPVAAVAGLGAAHGNGKAEHNGAASPGNWPVEMVTRAVKDAEPLALFCFKTLSDPFAGQISFFKVFSGCAHADDAVTNFTQNAGERLAHLSVMQGKRAIEVRELHAGDIGAVPKLKNTRTGDTLGEKTHPVHYEPAKQPEPVLAYAIEARTRADEDKMANALHRIMEEDTQVRFYRDAQTQEFLLAGSGQQHIEMVISRLRRRYHTEVTLQAPRIPYRETIRTRAEGHGRHKKQSGGHGQFGDCKIRIEPLERGAGVEFVNQIFGGAIPKNFIPAVEKGIRDAAERGFLAGHPLVDFRATVYDGSYHEVDSNELSFRIAGRLALRACMEQARPALMEPILHVEIQTPEAFSGAVMGDLNSRRGRVVGMDSSGAGQTVIEAEAPMAEMLTYGVDLTAMTQGQGSFHAEVGRYDFVPAALQEKVVAASRQLAHVGVADEE
jgi:elongation factor G